MPRIILFALFLLAGLPANAQSAKDTLFDKAAKAHYEYLSKEIQNHRAFLEKERASHQDFLEWYYKLTIGGAGAVIAVFLFLITYYGVKTRKDLREEINVLKEEALKKTEKEITQAREELNSQVAKEFATEKQNYEMHYQAWVKWLKQQISVDNGQYLMISESGKLEEMRQVGAEVGYLKNAFEHISFSTIEEARKSLSLKGIDVLLYRSNVDEKGIDAYLEKELIPLLKQQPERIPLVVYAKGRNEFVKDSTEDALNRYLQYQLANNIGTLIDNTASSLRAYRLLKKESPHA